MPGCEALAKPSVMTAPKEVHDILQPSMSQCLVGCRTGWLQVQPPVQASRHQTQVKQMSEETTQLGKSKMWCGSGGTTPWEGGG